jgi:hypothetical protein
VAPLTAVRDPQRWMNQITSDIAYRLRVAGGKLTLIAKEGLTDSNYTEQDLEMKTKEGGVAVMGASQLGGLQNSHAVVDTSPGAEIYNMMGMLPQAKSIAESSTGVYEQNFGAPQGQDQLVGTLQLQLQQAGVMQQPFYAAVADLFRQQKQFYAQAGRQFYTRMPWILRQMVGDEDAEAMMAAPDAQMEQFRVNIDLVQDSKQLRIITDQQTIPGLLQLGMLDPTTAAQLLGRSTPNDAYDAAREYTKMAAEAQAEQAQQMQQAQQQQAVAMEQAAIRDEEADIAKQQTEAEIKAKANEIKESAPYRQADADWYKPQDPVNPTVA